jgi:hypothetical protein
MTLQGSTIAIGTAIRPSTGVITLSGQPPTVQQAAIITPTAGALTFAGQAPALQTQIQSASGSLAWTGGQPSLTIAGIEPETLAVHDVQIAHSTITGVALASSILHSVTLAHATVTVPTVRHSTIAGLQVLGGNHP